MEEDGPRRASMRTKALAPAVKRGFVGTVKFLLWTGARIECRENMSKRTILHMACEKDDVLMVETLLRSGAYVNATDINGRTPLHEACHRSHADVAEILLDNGAKLNLADKCGTTPLHEVLGHCNDDQLHFFINVIMDNSEPNIRGTENEERRLKVDTQDEKGDAALHLASMRNDEDLVSSFLDRGAQVGVKNAEGMTALHSAARACAGDVVHVLVDNGADVNAKDINGNTPLHFACSTNYYKDTYYCRSTASRVKTVENLLSRGASIYEENTNKKTPYEELEECYSSSNPSLEVKTKIEEIFIKHVTILTSLNLQKGPHSKWILGSNYFALFSHECWHELKEMKYTIILKSISIFDVLSHTIIPTLLSADDLLEVAETNLCLILLNRFPLYGPSIRNFFKRTEKPTMKIIPDTAAEGQTVDESEV